MWHAVTYVYVFLAHRARLKRSQRGSQLAGKQATEGRIVPRVRPEGGELVVAGLISLKTFGST